MNLFRSRVRRLTFLTGAFGVAGLGAVIAGSAWWIRQRGSGRLYSVESVPTMPVALILGSSVENGVPGSYVTGRLNTGIALYRAGKVERLLVTGNAAGKSGDEPTIMRKYLLEQGIADEVIDVDPLGIDTHDSLERATVVFGITRCAVVTQGYHLARSVSLGLDCGVDVVGVRAPVDTTRVSWLRNHAREYILSRPKAVLDILRGREVSGVTVEDAHGPRRESLANPATR